MLLDKETLMNLYSANNIDYEIGICLNLILLGLRKEYPARGIQY